MKKLSNLKMERVKGGYTAWDCFWSVPKLIMHNGSSYPSNIGLDLALIHYCWNN